MIITLIDAINKALHFALQHDQKTILIGEDIGKNGLPNAVFSSDHLSLSATFSFK